MFPEQGFPKFTAQYQKVLRNLRIDEHTPGPIVHDFDAIVAFFREKEQPLTDTLQLPPKLLPLLNARMAHPVPKAPPRSGIKAYPHLFGLYLLLRSSAMTRLEWRGSKVFLKVHEPSYALWQTLSPAERYCSLLEIWLEYANGYTLHSTFQFRFGAWNDVTFMFTYTQNWPTQFLPDLLSYVQKASSAYNLGLLHLFGWIEVQEEPPQEGKGWQITNLSFTPLGMAMVVAIVNTMERYEKHLQKITKNNDLSGIISLTKFTLQSYLTQWEKRYVPASIPFKVGAYTFKVTLQEAMRRIQISSDATLEHLANAILQSVRFDNDHGYEFEYLDYYGIPQKILDPFLLDSLFGMDGFNSDEIQVGHLGMSVGQSMTFLYGHDDEWLFNIQLEAVDTEARMKGTKVVERSGKAPRQYSNNW